MQIEVGKRYRIKIKDVWTESTARVDDTCCSELPTVLLGSWYVYRETGEVCGFSDWPVEAVEGGIDLAMKVYAAQPEVSFDSIKVNVVVTDKPVTMLGDEPGALDRFRRVFATWDFSQFAR